MHSDKTRLPGSGIKFRFENFYTDGYPALADIGIFIIGAPELDALFPRLKYKMRLSACIANKTMCRYNLGSKPGRVVQSICPAAKCRGFDEAFPD